MSPIEDKQQSIRHAFEKVVVNTGIGRLSTQANFEEKVLPNLIAEFADIVGQRPAVRRAKKSIAGFKIRAGMPVGLAATLRGKRMAHFLEKFISVTLPRMRDFRGIDLACIDNAGNVSIGIRDQFVFPETNPETSRANFGIEITAVLRRKSGRENALAELKRIGIPFKKKP